MNKNAKKWVEVLRSGKYKQGQYYLKKGDEFCCLGVACEIYGEENGVNWSYDGKPQIYRFLGENGELPNALVDWLGMNSKTGLIELESSIRVFGSVHKDWDSSISLASLNDEEKSFKEIADIIEEHQDILFKKELTNEK